MKRLKYLKPLLLFMGIALLITTLSRFFLMLFFGNRVFETNDFGMIFPIGFRMDLIIICYLSIIPAAILSLVPNKFLKYFNRFLQIYFTLFLFLFLFMELVTPDFIDQYDTRPNRLFIEYLIYPKEIASMLINSRLSSIIVVLLISGIGLYFGFKYSKKIFTIEPATYKTRLLLFPLILFILFCGMRGSLISKRPFNPSNAVFSNDQMTNSLGINSLYSVIYSGYTLKNEADASKLYGKMDENEAYNRVKKYMGVPNSDFTNLDIPFLHIQQPDSILERPYNLVIFLQESLGAEFVGCLGGMPLTPELDKLSKEGMLFTQLYCTGTRSVRGIEALTTGFLPSPSESVVKLSNAQSGFFTLANLLKRSGYNTSFVYGGISHFDNMASFFNGNGFDNIIDEKVMDNDGNKYAFKSTWGYSDEDLVTKANEYYKSLGNKPFFSLMFSSSNHEPFDFPKGRIELYDQPQNTVHNAMKYADYAIGKFFEMAKKEAYYKNTVFIVVADHNTRTFGRNLVPLNKFHIPALIVSPNITQQTTYNKLCSQIDLPPTLLSIIGMKTEHPMPGRNLQSLPDSIPGRSIMQYHDINGFRVENQVIFMQPNKSPLQFEIKSDTTLIPTELNEELAKDALGHVLSAEYLYKGRKYRLPQ